tara:strand:- start:857 stop:1114 length:258 start_codon:yes stop_codon:yes gene_type:complete
MFWGLSGCPPETVERVLKNYNELVAKKKEEESKEEKERVRKEENYKKFKELVKKNPPSSFKDILEYSMILSYYTKELNNKKLTLM